MHSPCRVGGAFESAAPQSRFALVVPPSDDVWVRTELAKVGTVLMRMGTGSVLRVFSDVDTSSDGCISYEEFQQALKLLKLDYSREQITRLAQSVDTDHSGQINYTEFVTAFHVTVAEHGGEGARSGAGAVARTPACRF